VSAESNLSHLEIIEPESEMVIQSLSFVGTPEYIAPEVVEGHTQTAAVDWWTFGILIYEMLCGRTPFQGAKPEETYRKIVNDQLRFPDDVLVSPAAANIVKHLLRREPSERLGASKGAEEIKAHKWFEGLNFALIRNLKPPFKPVVPDYQALVKLGKTTELSRAFSSDSLDVETDDLFANFNITKNVDHQY